MHLKKTKVLLGVIMSGIFLLGGCASKSERSARESVVQELEKLQSSDSQTIQNTIDTQQLLSSSQYTEETAEEIGDIYSLFYKDFSFKIKKVTVDEDKGTGKAVTTLTTIDACNLAKDYSLSLLEKQVESEADPEEVKFSLNDSCILLKKLLEENDYGTETSEAEISLKKEGDSWKVIHTSKLDSLLTGNFASYMSDSRLLSPSEIVDAHFSTIKGFGDEQLITYLSLDQLVDTDDSYNHSLAAAIGEQIRRSFDYEITGEDQEAARLMFRFPLQVLILKVFCLLIRRSLPSGCKPRNPFPTGLREDVKKKDPCCSPALKKTKLPFPKILLFISIMTELTGRSRWIPILPGLYLGISPRLSAPYPRI